MDFSVGCCSDSWCVSPSNIGSSPQRSISYSDNWRKNIPRPSGGSELQNQADGPTSQMNPFDRMNVKISSRRAKIVVPFAVWTAVNFDLVLRGRQQISHQTTADSKPRDHATEIHHKGNEFLSFRLAPI